MSLITIDDDSSEELADAAVDSDAGDADAALSNEQSENSTENSCAKSATICLEDDSCDTVPAETSNETNHKPLLELMKHLINYNGKQNTTLTNAQLVNILQYEFKIDISNVHVLTLEIYMNILKKFLKDWPRWDEFDRIMHESRCMNDSEEIEKMLELEYQSLKEYLAGMLKACKPFAREATQSTKRMLELPPSSQQSSGSGPGDVELEIHCTRDQLNSLFFRKPHSDLNDTIFNVDSSVPKRINLQNWSFKSILNSSHISVGVNMNCFKYKRELVHNFKHMLVNKKNPRQAEEIKLNRHLQISKNTKTGPVITKKDVKIVIQKILRSNRYSINIQQDVESLFQTISNDIDNIQDDFNAQSMFRHFMNAHPYVRYLYEDSRPYLFPTENEKYDLQLEETVSPRLKFSVLSVCLKQSAVNSDIGWLKLACTYCNLNFIGVEGIEQLKSHFMSEHLNEPDWMCTNCEEAYTVVDLASKRWFHKCYV